MIRQGDSRYALNIKNGYRYLPKGARRLFNLDSTLQAAMKPVLIDQGSIRR
jgi:hypothetical protein